MAILGPLLINTFSVLLILSLTIWLILDFGLYYTPCQNQDLASGKFRAESLSTTQETFYLYYESKLGRELMYLNTCRIALQ